MFNNDSNRDLLREVIVKIGLERINIQEDIAVETLLNSKMIKLVIFGVHKKAKVQAEEKDQYV